MHKPVAVTYRNRSIDDVVEIANTSGKLLREVTAHPSFTVEEKQQIRGQMNDFYRILIKISDQCMLLLRSQKSVHGVLYYHEQKLKQGVAECLYAGNMIKDARDLTLKDKQFYLQRLESLNDRVEQKDGQCHTRVSPG